MLNTTDTARFEQCLHGRLIRPEDADFDEARTLYNAMIDKRPRLIVCCANVADVMAAVRFGRQSGLPTAIRGGGHNGPGLALVDDGLVIDLSAMKGIRVDADARRVRVEPGYCWGDVDHVTHAFGLATVSGIISSTGVGGLTLGGGHGYLTRKYGLAIDNLVSADVVMANGQLVHANESEHPDLFWAIRGGGGNFGVVTSFEFRLHPVDKVFAGPMFWSLDDLESTLGWYRDWLPSAPEDAYAFYLVGQVPAADPFPEHIRGRNVCGMQWCFTGSEPQKDDALEQVRKVARPLFEMVDEFPYPALQGMFDGLYPPGLQWYWKGDFVRKISDAAIAVHRRFAEVPTSQSTMHLYPVDGAAGRVAAQDTAWAHRDARWSMVIAGVDSNSSNVDAISHWAREYWQVLHPHTSGAAYINFMMEEGNARIEATYGINHEGLRKVKAKYDPDNFFHVNQNIEPARDALPEPA